ncbi:hypothetical protein BGZ72_005253 [Mortierella alpina]|nr:hypothetical protein BGZ72_005253 [Mortierella alpina]
MLTRQQQRQQQQQHTQSGQPFKKSASVTLLRSRDSGIMLDDEYWHHNSNSSGNRHHPKFSDMEPPLETIKTKMATIQDPGLLILQVTQFGTIDHAFAIPQSTDVAKRMTGWSSTSSSGRGTKSDDQNDGDDEQDESVFLAHDRVAVEAMASDAVMAYVHPQELSALCKGLDQVCKARYTVFRARWRVDAPSSEGMLSDEDDEDLESGGDDLNLREVDHQCRIIEFQGERFEEWVDPSSAATTCSQGVPVEEQEDEKSSLCRYQASSSQDPASFVPIPTFMGNTDDEEEDDDQDGYLEMELELDSLCSEQTLVQDDGESKVDWRTLTDEVRKRMDLEEGLSLSRSGGTAVSRLSDLSSLTSSAVCTLSPRSKLEARVQQQQPPCHSNRRTLLITFSPTAAASSLVLVSLPILSSIALDAWRQWVQIIHLTREQFQAWSEYLLDLALGQTIETVSFGMTILGCAPRPCLSAPTLVDYDYDHYNNPVETDSKMQQVLAQELCQRTTVMTVHKSHSPQENEAIQAANKISGLNRAGKVLEAHYPALEGVVRHLGQSWLGHRIMATVQLEEKLDVVADQVVDWWESEDRVAALVASSVPPLLNTLTAYTPLSFLSRRLVNGRTAST